MKVACLWFKVKAPTTRVAELCFKLSPQICIRESEAVFVEIGKCRKLYSEEGFLARVQVLLRKLNLSARIGIADTISGALIKAKYLKSNQDELPLEALLDFADPFNKDLVLQKYVQKMISSFTDLGINNMGQFKKIPLQELVSRFGSSGTLCRQRVDGEMTTPWTFWKPDEIIFEKSEFPYFEFYGELEPLLFELKKQLDQIFQRLWARELKAQKLQVKIFCEKSSANPNRVRVYDFDFLFPQGVTKGALNVIKERLTRDFEKQPILSPIEGLQTWVVAAVPGFAAQKNIFHNREEVAEQRQALLGQLAEIHGGDNIFHVELTEDRRPEKSWKKKQGAIKDSEKVDRTLIKIPKRPHYLLKSPEPIEVTAGFIHLRKKRYSLLKWSNDVERITGGWIEQATDLKSSFERSYYHVQIEGNIRLFIFQDADQKFYLHGYFG